MHPSPSDSKNGDDPRLGFTSASSAEPDLLCPGRHLAQRGLKGYDTRESESGTMVHAAFAGTLDADTLSPGQRRTIARGREIEEFIVRQWFKCVGGTVLTDSEIMKRAHRELRLWAFRNGNKIHSGGIDALWLARDMRYALVEDLKSLFGDVDDAASNQQLRDYAALVHMNYGCEEVAVFINQPNVRWKMEEQKLVIYAEADLSEAVREMYLRVRQSNDPKAPRFPGSVQCRFCLACGTARCPESMKELFGFTAGFKQEWEFFDPAQRGAVIKEAKNVERISERVLAVAKDALKKDPKWAEGWMVTDDCSVRKIKDEKVHEIANVLIDAFAGEKHSRLEIASAMERLCTVTLGNLEELHASLTDAATVEDQRAEFKVLFGHLIENHTRCGTLKPVK